MMTLVVITGASQGIGAAIAQAFSQEENIHLILLARTEAKLQKIVADCQQQGAKADYLICDVTHEENVKQVADFILLKWGVPDVLVNNAGIFAPSSFFEGDYAEFKAQLDANLNSAFLVSKAFLPAMIEQKRGDVFFLGSIASLGAYKNSAFYTTAKHGLLGLARSLREETKDKGLRVTVIMPGAVKTPAWDGVDLPLERFIPAEDIGKIVVTFHQLNRSTVVEEIIVRPRMGDIE
jgi:NADP-dependent 3-hydroxy acid dehydrogenase YdfG